MKGKFICNICGKDHNDLNDYASCVSTCYEKKIREKETKIALNELKQAKAYYEQKLKEFKEKYPKEYDLNFGENVSCESCKSYDCEEKTSDDLFNTIAVSITDDGDGKPKVDARVNGKKVDDDTLSKLFDDPDTRYIAKMLGIL